MSKIDAAYAILFGSPKDARYEHGVWMCYMNPARPHLLVGCKCCDANPLGFKRCEKKRCGRCQLRIDRVLELRK